jgi:hypothetical protein
MGGGLLYSSDRLDRSTSSTSAVSSSSTGTALQVDSLEFRRLGGHVRWSTSRLRNPGIDACRALSSDGCDRSSTLLFRFDRSSNGRTQRSRISVDAPTLAEGGDGGDDRQPAVPLDG